MPVFMAMLHVAETMRHPAGWMGVAHGGGVDHGALIGHVVLLQFPCSITLQARFKITKHKEHEDPLEFFSVMFKVKSDLIHSFHTAYNMFTSVFCRW